MNSIRTLPIRNLLKKPARSVALMILAAFLSISAFGGAMAVTSLQNGLNALEARLGADIVVVPYEATTKGTVDGVLLQGQPGHFYMSKELETKAAAEEGVAQVSSQIYLASAKASCCSARVQLIGYDPETDFSVRPWIEKSYSNELQKGDVLIGSDISPTTAGEFKIFGQTLRVVGQLEKTGTNLDVAVYANGDTVKDLIKAAQERNFASLLDVDSDKVISSIMVKVEEGYDIEDVVSSLNHHLRGAVAIRTKSMITSVSGSLGGISGMIGVMMVVVWALSVTIMAIAFSMIINERRKEFAVLRVLGASRSRLSGIVFQESILLSLAGSLIGVGVTLAVMLLFADGIENGLGLPFLMPSAGLIAIFAAAAAFATVLAGAVTAAFSAYKTGRIDTGIILRGDN